MITFWLNDEFHDVLGNVDATTTLLRYLRDYLRLTGTKEGCAEGDCGACTVVISEERPDGSRVWRAVNSCLLFLAMVDGRVVYTVEGLRDRGQLPEHPTSGYHAVQRAVVDVGASQCGFCTPGVVMSLFAAHYRQDLDPSSPRALDEQMAGNLCRCTGYRPIREAAALVAGQHPDDRFRAALKRHERIRASWSWFSGTQNYHQPIDVRNLLRLRVEHPEALLVAGGTDVALGITKRHLQHPEQPNEVPRRLIGMEQVWELRQIQRLPTGWQVGAMVSLTQLQETVSPRLPGLEKMLRVFGSRQIRNRATVGGSLCNASPIGDLAPLLLALDAELIIAGSEGDRRLPLREFFVGYRQTALRHPEVLRAVEWQDPPTGVFFTSYKVSRRRELDISAVSAGMWLELNDDGRVSTIRLAFGGVAATPVRASHTEAFLQGQPWTEPVVRQAMPLLEQDFTPISDLRGSAEYRARVARNLLLGFFLESQQPHRDLLEERPAATVSFGPRSTP